MKICNDRGRVEHIAVVGLNVHMATVVGLLTACEALAIEIGI